MPKASQCITKSGAEYIVIQSVTGVRDVLMLSEEGMVVAALLMALNAIDYNVMMKREDFDKSMSMQSFVDSVLYCTCT